MQAMIDELAKQAAESLGQVSSKETLASFWQEYLSKNGKIPALMKNLRSVAPEERPSLCSGDCQCRTFHLGTLKKRAKSCRLHGRRNRQPLDCGRNYNNLYDIVNTYSFKRF